MKQEDCKNGDAFKLYWYACVEGPPYYSPQANGSKKRIKTIPCGHRERIWNCRDGVVPFGTTCPSCGGMMQHVDWSRDFFDPKHTLKRFQKFWTNMTLERAREIATRMQVAAAAHGRMVPDFNELVEAYMRRGDEPMLWVYMGDE